MPSNSNLFKGTSPEDAAKTSTETLNYYKKINLIEKIKNIISLFFIIIISYYLSYLNFDKLMISIILMLFNSLLFYSSLLDYKYLMNLKGNKIMEFILKSKGTLKSFNLIYKYYYISFYLMIVYNIFYLIVNDHSYILNFVLIFSWFFSYYRYFLTYRYKYYILYK